MTIKIVYNACHGGFSLSERAHEELSRESAQKKDWYNHRHDPALVRVVERLGDAASGRYSRLRVAELSGNRYWIDEYDGAETVHGPDTIPWTVVDDEAAP